MADEPRITPAATLSRGVVRLGVTALTRQRVSALANWTVTC